MSPGQRAGPPSEVLSDEQKHYMRQIVSGMGAGDIRIVAQALSGAVKTSVSIPEVFLVTVKQWMDSRQQSVAQPIQPQNSFPHLRAKLEEAIARNDTQEMSTILQQAVQLAAVGDLSMLQLPLRGIAPHTAFSKSAPSQVLLSQAPFARLPDWKAEGETLSHPPTESFKDAPTETTPAGVRERSPTFSPVDKADKGRDDVKKERRARTPRLSLAGKLAAKLEAPVVAAWPSPQVNVNDLKTEAALPEEPHDGDVPEASDRDATPDEIANFLRSQPDDSATFRRICAHFAMPAASDSMRTTIIGRPALFAVAGDMVSLKDPQRKEALSSLVQKLVSRPLTQKRIKPDEACGTVHAAAKFALQAYPDDVVRVLVEISKYILRRTAAAVKGHYPANMPLVIMCLVDQIVMLERQQRRPPKFEQALGPIVHSLIFQRWVLGVVPGSQFLANLLITWQRLGYFKEEHLEQPRKTLWLLLAYAPSTGIPDPDREKGVGWYRIVQRPADCNENTEAISGRRAPVRSVRFPDTAANITIDLGLDDATSPSQGVTLPTQLLPTEGPPPRESSPHESPPRESAHQNSERLPEGGVSGEVSTGQAGEPPLKRQRGESQD